MVCFSNSLSSLPAFKARYCKPRCAFCDDVYMRGLTVSMHFCWINRDLLAKHYSKHECVSTKLRVEEPKWHVKGSALTFGTRNWTVRDIPPSHEAISIMKPANQIRFKFIHIYLSAMFSVFNCWVMLQPHNNNMKHSTRYMFILNNDCPTNNLLQKLCLPGA